MDSELALTRRDVVALVIYVALAYNVLISLLSVLGQLVIPRISYLRTSIGSGNSVYYAVSFGLSLVFALAFLPFVSLIASGVAGRTSSHLVMRPKFFSLVLPCTGIVLFVLSFPGLARGIYLLFSVSSGSSGTTIRPYYLQNIALNLVWVSVGFALAFFPAIFGALRDNARGEENGAWAGPTMDAKPDEL